ncbi:hypothetical protein WN51_11220 [Melipona quadrifasciata]|uniref:Uncharacterized protein n=1 Tax=Melipona quadrifasciata TaxID=166423 RepID=A0A0M9A3Q4_9HYME|nr:hypothetical protein WN51_11220 [Melipona quadrifasciata]
MYKNPQYNYRVGLKSWQKLLQTVQRLRSIAHCKTKQKPVEFICRNSLLEKLQLTKSFDLHQQMPRAQFDSGKLQNCGLRSDPIEVKQHQSQSIFNASCDNIELEFYDLILRKFLRVEKFLKESRGQSCENLNTKLKQEKKKRPECEIEHPQDAVESCRIEIEQKFNPSTVDKKICKFACPFTSRAAILANFLLQAAFASN